MKKSILILAVLLPLFGLAQNEKSSFFIETGVTKISILETGLIASVSYNFKINRKKKE